MWITANWLGCKLTVWKWVYDGTPSNAVGQLRTGQVWAQIDSDGPYRPVLPIKEE